MPRSRPWPNTWVSQACAKPLTTLAGAGVKLRGRDVYTEDMLQAVTITVGVSQEEECYIEGTRYEPSMPGQAEVWASNISVCHTTCQRTAGCAHFTYWRKYKGCLFQNASATPLHDPNTTAGPNSCALLPLGFEEPSDAALALAATPKTGSSWMSWMQERPEVVALPLVILLFVVPALLAAAHHVYHRRRGGRRGPNSRSGEALYNRVSTDGERVEYQPMSTVAEVLPYGGEVSPADLASPQAHEATPSKLSTGMYAASQQSGQPTAPPSALFLRPENIGIDPSGMVDHAQMQGMQEHAQAQGVGGSPCTHTTADESYGTGAVVGW